MTLGIVELVPRWVFVAAIAALTLGFLHESHQHKTARAELAELKTVVAEQKAAAERTARLAAEEKLALLQEHNRKTKEAEDAFLKDRAAAQERARADAATVDRLRKQIAGFTSGGGRTDQTPAAANIGLADRLATLGSLFGESLDLLAEGRSIIDRRDAEVMLLRTQIETDRNACQSGDNGSK